MRRVVEIRTWLGLAACVAMLLTFPTTPVKAQSLNLLACKKVIPRGAVEGSELIMQGCGSRFTTQAVSGRIPALPYLPFYLP